MSSKCIKTLILATAIATCTWVGFSGLAEAHYRTNKHYGWHSGGHKDAHRGWERYGYARPASYAHGRSMGAAAYGCPPADYGYAGEQGDGGVGLGAPTF